MVEFALTILITLSLIFAIIVFSYTYYEWTRAQNDADDFCFVIAKMDERADVMKQCYQPTQNIRDKIRDEDYTDVSVTLFFKDVDDDPITYDQKSIVYAERPVLGMCASIIGEDYYDTLSYVHVILRYRVTLGKLFTSILDADFLRVNSFCYAGNRL